MTGNSTSPAWWGKYSIEPDQTVYWRIGPLEIWVWRTAREWRIGTRNHPDLNHAVVVINQNHGPQPPSDETIKWNRFGFRQTTATLELKPFPAPRPVVVSPETTFLLPPDEETSFFISTPVWVHFELDRQAARLLETFTFRLSDTWFGPSTMTGEFCFASRTRARFELADLKPSLHRIFSAFSIRNRAKTALKIERLKLPMPNLSVFAAADGRLWTEAVTLDRREDGDFAELQVGQGPPDSVQPAALLSGPQEKPEKGLSIRSFGGLFG
jgi:hypothetical protein